MRGTGARVFALVIGLVGLAGAAVVAAAPAGAQDGQPQITICHREGNGSSHTITVALPSLPAHLGHGDTLGPCPDPDPDPDPDPGPDPEDRVTICHREGNGSSHSITVDESAVAAHLAHGDSLGHCPAVVPPLIPPQAPPPPVVISNPVARPAPPAAPVAPPTAVSAVSAVAAAPAQVAELPRTGAGEVVVPLVLAVAFLALGGLLVQAGARAESAATATLVPSLVPAGPAPFEPGPSEARTTPTRRSPRPGTASRSWFGARPPRRPQSPALRTSVRAGPDQHRRTPGSLSPIDADAAAPLGVPLSRPDDLVGSF